MALAIVLPALVGLHAPSLAGAAPRVSVQPFDGPGATELRQRIAQLLRAHGLTAVTTLAAVSGTAQYPGLAREHALAAFVTAGVEERHGRVSVSFFVWHGAGGMVAGRWTVSASTRHLPREIARGFWKHLGRAIETAPVPATADDSAPEPLFIDAASPDDEVLTARP